MRVFVYYNLRKRVWSVKALEGEKKGLVVAHLPVVYLTDCRFKVSEKLRQRVIREKQKNVHAGVVGRLTHGPVGAQGKRVRYNPYLRGEFFLDSGEAIQQATTVAMWSDRSVEAW